MKSGRNSLIAVLLAGIAAMLPVSAANAFPVDDIALAELAYNMCESSPGFAALGYANFETCFAGTYQDLLQGRPLPVGCGGGICPVR